MGHACRPAQAISIPLLHALGLHHPWLATPCQRLRNHEPYLGHQLSPLTVQLRIRHVAHLRKGARLWLVLKVVPGAPASKEYLAKVTQLQLWLPVRSAVLITRYGYVVLLVHPALTHITHGRCRPSPAPEGHAFRRPS